MKPFVERISRDHKLDWMVREFHCRDSHFEWHYHLEYELVLALDCAGQWFVGSHTGDYENGAAMLVAPHLPHTSIITEQDPNLAPTTYILWFTHEWVSQIIAAMPEFKPLMAVLRESGKGLGFSATTGLALKQAFEATQQTDNRAQQLIHVLQILHTLQHAADKQTFNVVNVCGAGEQDLKKADQLTRFVEQNYQRSITLADIADSLNTSESTVRRLFQKHFNESYSEHIKQYRIGKACELLINTELPVALIAEQTGFNNLSNFHRQFSQVKQQTPRQFRLQYQQAAALGAA